MASYRAGAIGVTDVADRVLRAWEQSFPAAGNRRLPYVPMDVLWLASDPAAGAPDLAAAVLAELKERPGGSYVVRDLYRLLQTAGARARDVLFIRMVAEAEAGDPILADEAAEAAAEADAGRAGARASALLSHSSPAVRHAAKQVLVRSPDPAALDPLWELHRTEDGPNTVRSAGTLQRYRRSMAALRACLRLDPEWVARAVAGAVPARDPMHDLAYLVAGLHGRGDLWRRLKPDLTRLVPPDKARALAANMYVHRDGSDADWLAGRISPSSDERLSASASRALAVVAPERALEAIDVLPPFTLYVTRNWCFAAMLVRRPDDARRRLFARLQREPGQVNLALVYQGHEDAMDVDTFDLLLDWLEAALEEPVTPDPSTPAPAPAAPPTVWRRAAALLPAPIRRAFGVVRNWLHPPVADQSGTTDATPPAPPIRPAHWSPRAARLLQLVSAVNHPDLLDRLAARASTVLETRLRDRLLEFGPREGVGWRPQVDDGLAVLRMIGAAAYTGVVNAWLRSASRFARQDGLGEALRRPDGDTVNALRDVSERAELNGSPFPQEQAEAAVVLAGLGRWREVVAFLVRWGVCPQELLSLRAGEPLNDHELGPALAELGQRPAEIPAGAILAAGISGRADFRTVLRAALAACSPGGPDRLRLCLAAVGCSANPSPEAIDLIVPHLRTAETRDAAMDALLRIGTAPAQAALLDLLTRPLDVPLATALLRRAGGPGPSAGAPDGAAGILRRHVAGAPADDLVAVAADLVRGGPRPADVTAIFSDAEAREALVEAAFADLGQARVGFRHPEVVRLVATFDMEAARLAASRALATPGAARRACRTTSRGWSGG